MNAPITSEDFVNIFTPNPQIAPQVAVLIDGSYVVVWQSRGQDGDGEGVVAQKFSAGGERIGAPVIVNETARSTQADPAIAATDDGGFVIVWEATFQDEPGINDRGVIGRRFNEDMSPAGDEFVVNVVNTVRSQFGSDVAATPGGGFAVVFSDDEDGSNFFIPGVRIRFFDETGSPTSPDFSVNPNNIGTESTPQIATIAPSSGANGLIDGGFAISWTASGQTFVQIYDAAGAPVGGEFEIAPTANQGETDAEVASLSDGRFVVVWTGSFDGSSNGVFAQVFEGDGSPVGVEFLVNVEISSTQSDASVAGLADGGFVVTWTSRTSGGAGDGNSDGVISRRFDADGTPLTGEEIVNETTLGAQERSAVAGLQDGNFVTVWQSDDGDGTGIFQRIAGDPATFAAPSASPVIEAISPMRNFAESALNAAPQRLDVDAAAAVSDADSANFDGGRLIVSILSRSIAEDDFPAQDGDDQDLFGFDDAGPVSISVDEVSVNGVVVGVISSDGAGGAALIVDLNANADPAAVEVLVENLTYQNLSDDPRPQSQIAILLEDGDGASSSPVVVTIDITPELDTVGPVRDEVRVNTFSRDQQTNPEVASTFDPVTGEINGYVAVWQSRDQDLQGAFDTGVYGQRYDADGLPIGAEFQINQTIQQSQFTPHVAGLEDGGFVVVWTDDVGDDSGVGVRLTRYDAAGVPVPTQTEITVNTQTSSNQDEASVVGLSDGGYQVTWTSDASGAAGDGSSNGVFTQRFNAADQRLGGEQQVNESTDGSQDKSDIAALAEGRFVVVWEGATSGDAGDGSGDGIFARLFTDQGVPAAGEFQVNSFADGAQTAPQVVTLSNGDFVVTWRSEGQDTSSGGIYGQRFSDAGAAIGDEFRVNDNVSGNQTDPSITALDDGKFVISWTDTSTPSPGAGADIFAQVFDVDGTRLDSDTRVNTNVVNSQLNSAIAALPGGAYVVLWESNGEAGDGFSNEIQTQIFGDPGAILNSASPEILGLAPTIAISETDANEGALLAPAGALSITDPDSADFDGGELSVRRAEVDANADDYSAPDDNGQDNLSLATGGRVSVNGAAVEVDGVVIGSLTSDGQDGADLVVAFNAEATVERVEALVRSLTYTNPSDNPRAEREYALRLTDGDGSSQNPLSVTIALIQDRDEGFVDPVGSEIQVNTFTTNAQDTASVATLVDGGWVVVWESDGQDSNGGGVFAQRYNADGSRNGAEFQVNTNESGSQGDPVVEGLANGGFVIAWEGPFVDEPGVNDTGILAQIYGADGAPLGGEIVLNATTVQSQFDAALSADPNGGFIAAWVSDVGDASQDAIIYQRFDDLGARVGPEVTANAGAETGNQIDPDLVVLATGEVLVVWTTSDGTVGDGSGAGVFGRIIDTAGAPSTGVFPINQETLNSQTEPQIAATSTGFVVAWSDGSGQDGSGTGVQARFFDDEGAPLGDEFTVNENRSSTQSQPRVAVLEDGRVVIAFATQQAPGGSGQDISGQIFAPTGERIDGEFRINTAISSTQSTPDITALPGGNFVVTWQSSSSGEVFQQIFGDPADFALGLADQIIGLPDAVSFTEEDVNAGLVRIDPDKTAAVPTLGDSGFDGGDFDGGVFEVSVDFTQRDIAAFSAGDDGGQHQIGFIPGDVGNGDVTVAGAAVSIDGVQVGTITSDGSNGQPLTIALNAAATNESVEALLGALGYANTSDDPVGLRLAVDLTSGAGVSAQTSFVDIAIEETTDSGLIAGDERRVNAYTDNTQNDPEIAELTGGGFVVVWESTNQDRILGDFDLGVFAQIYAADGAPLGPEIRVNTTVDRAQFDPDVAATADGGFVVVWTGTNQDNPGDNNRGVIAQRFTAEGAQNGGEIVVNTTVSQAQFSPAVSAFVDGGYVVTFTSDIGDGSQSAILSQRVDATGALLGEAVVNSTTSGNQFSSDVAALFDPTNPSAAAGHVVVWTDPSEDGSSNSVRGRLFDALGAPLSDDFRVSTTTPGSQSDPAVAVLNDGGFVVAWSGSGVGDSIGVFAQRYDAAGAKVGGEFRVNETISSSQTDASVSGLSDGGYVITWQGSGVGDSSGVFAQVYDAAGLRVDGEQRVNVETSSTQSEGAVTGLSTGGFAVAYGAQTSGGSGDGSGFGVFLRSFEPLQSAVAPALGDVERDVFLAVADVAAGPVVLDDAVAFSAPEGSDFGGGSIFVYYTRGPAALDQLSVASAGAVTVSGSDVLVGGTVVGVIDAVENGADGADLRVVFSTGATAADAKAVFEALAFSSTDAGANLVNTERGIGFIVTDGDGRRTEPDSIDVTISSSVSSPAISIDDFGQSENEGVNSLGTALFSELVAAPRLLDADIDIDISSGASFDGGFLVVIPSSNRQQTLSIRDQGAGVGEIGFDGETVSFGGVAIGAIASGNEGLLGAPLRINLNAAATTEAVEALAENITIQLESGVFGSFSSFRLQVTNASNTTSSGFITLGVVDDRVDVVELSEAAPEERVNTFADSNQASPRIAALADGGYVVVWTSQAQDNPAETSSLGIFGQHYNEFGDQVGVEFQINDIPTGSQSQPRVEALSTGEFIIAWTEPNRDGSGFGVYAQRFDADGDRVGAVFLLNETIPGNQVAAEIADLGGGRFLVVWVDASGADGSGFGVFGRVFDANGDPDGTEFQINTTTSGTQTLPRTTVLEDGDVLVTWQSDTGDESGTGVFAQRIDQTGDLTAFDGAALTGGATSDERLINTTTTGAQDRPDVTALAASAALPNGGFAIVWESPDGSGDGIFAQIFDIAGAPVGGEFQVNQLTSSNQREPVLVGTADGGFVVLWTDDSGVDGSSSGIVAQRVGADGVLEGRPFIVNSEIFSTQDQAEIAALDNGALVAVYRTFEENNSSSDIAQRIIDAPAGPDGAMSPSLVGFETTASFDEAAVNAGSQLIDPDGVLSLTDMDSADFDGGALIIARIAGSAGVFDGQFGASDGPAQEQLGFLDGAGIGISGTLVLLNGVQIGAIVQDGAGGSPLEIAFTAAATPEAVEQLLARLAYANTSDDPAASRQFGVQVTDGDGGSTGTQLLTVEITPEVDRPQTSLGADDQVNTATVSSQDNAATATLFDPVTGDPSGYVTVWESDQQDRPQDPSSGLFGQLFDLNGVPVGGEFQVNAHTEFSQTLPAVAGLTGGGFVVAWTNDSFANPAGLLLGEVDTGVFGRVFDAAGAPLGQDFLINEQTQSTQNEVSVTGLGDGGFAATWRSINSGPAGDGSSDGVFARTFDSDGAARSGEFGVNSTTVEFQTEGDVTQLANGDLAFVWTSRNQDSPGLFDNGLFARVTDAAGATVIAEFQVNTTVSGQQDTARIEALSTGGFVVVWEDNSGIDGSSTGIFQQRYDATGAPVGGETRVNATTSSSQFDSDVAALPDGGWVVVWTDNSAADGSGSGVFGQVYAADGDRVDGEFQINSEVSSTQSQASVSALADGGFVVSFTSFASGDAGDGDPGGVFQQIFATPGAVAQSVDPVLQGVAATVSFDEADLNAGLQPLYPGVSLGDVDSPDFDGGVLTLTVLENASIIDAFTAPDDGAQDQFGVIDGDGVTRVGAEIRFGGVVIGSVEGSGVDGAPFVVALNASADLQAVEALIERLGYANISNDPELDRQISLTLTDGDGGIVRAVTAIEITPEDDAFRPVDDEVQTNSFVTGTQEDPAMATLFDPATGAANGYVVTWTSTNQDATGDNDRGVFGQVYDASGAPVGGEFQINTNTTSAQFASQVIGLSTGGFAVTWLDNSGQDESSQQVYVQVFDAAAQKVGVETFVDASGFFQDHPALAAFDNGDFVIVRDAQNDQSPFQQTIVAQRFSDQGGAVGLEFEIEEPGGVALTTPDAAVLSDGKLIIVFQGNGLEDDASGVASQQGVFGQLYAADGSAIGGMFQINTRERFNQDNARVAATEDGGFVVVYESDFNDDFGFTTSPGVYAQRFDGDANAVGAEILVNEVVESTQFEPDVIAQPGGGFTVVFSDFNNTDGSSSGVFSQTFDAAGARVDGQVLINQEVSSSQDSGAVASLNDGNYVVAWRSAQSGDAGDGSGSGVFQRIVGDAADFGGAGDPVLDGVNRTVSYEENLINGVPQLIDANGAAAISDPDSGNFEGGALLVSNVISSAPLIAQINPPDDLTQDILGLRQGPRIAITGDDVVIDGALVGAIVQDGQSGAPFEIRFTANATPELVELLVENLTYRNVSDDPLPVRELRIQLTDGAGGASDPALVTVTIAPTVDAAVPLGGERRANTETSGEQDTPAIATLSDGGFIIVWESFGQDGSREGIYAQRFDALGNPAARDGAALASSLTDEFLVNTSTSNDQSDPAVVGLNDGGFLISWSDDSGRDGSGVGVFAQRFDGAGAKVASDGGSLAGGSGEFQLNVLTSSTQNQSDVAALQGANDGAFVTVWHSETSGGAGDGSSSAVIGRVFTPAGQSEFVINSETLSDQDAPQIIALADGGLYVVWQSFSTTDGDGALTADGSRFGVFAQRFDAAFAPAGGEIQINQRVSGDQFDPQVTALESGDLVVTWTNDNADGSGQGVFAQIVDPNGAPQTAEFRVNDQRISTQSQPDIAALDTGGFVITWQDSNATDGSGTGVFAQQYDANGGRVDSQFQVNTNFASTQDQPVVTALEGGGFAIAWASTTSTSGGNTAGDGSGDGVFYQVFANASPEVSDVQAVGAEDTVIVLGADLFEAGFVDPDGQTLQAIRIATLPAQGDLSVNGNPATPGQEISIAALQAGALTYLGAQDFNGLDGFEWTGSDGISFADDLVTASIVVTPVNDAPALEAGPDVTIAEGGLLQRTLTLGDPDNDLYSFTVDYGDGSPVDAFTTTVPNRTIQNRYAGEGVFTVTVMVDDNAGETNSVEVDSFVVTVENAPPIASNDFRTVSEDGPAANFGDPRANDVDPGDDAFTVTAFAGVTNADPDFIGVPVTLPSGALVTLNAAGEFIYDPNGAFETLSVFQNGSDSFSYTITDEDGATDTANVVITISGQNDLPVAVDDGLVANDDTPISANVLNDNGMGADFDVDDGAVLTVTALNGEAGDIGVTGVILPSGATVTLLADGSLDYDPTTLTSSIESDSFTYTVSDDRGDRSSAEVTITINQTNQAPIAEDDAVTANEDAPLIGGDLFADNGAGLDRDTDGDPISVSQVNGVSASVGAQITLGSGALLTVRSNGTFDYNPNGQFETLPADATDTDSFTYTISDGAGGTNDATVTVTIEGENDAPFAGGVTAMAIEDGPVVTGDLLAESADIDIGDMLSVSRINGSALAFNTPITLGSGAMLTVAQDGGYSYDPGAAFQSLAEGGVTSEIVTFTVSDGQGGADDATLFVTVTGVNDDPDALDDAFTVAEDAPLAGDLLADNGVGADSDVDAGDAFTVTAVNGVAASVGATITLASGALLTVNASGTFTYDQNGAFEDLAEGAAGTDSFTYEITDGFGAVDSATATVDIVGGADTPVARDDAFALGENGTASGDVLADNGAGPDQDPDGEAVTVVALNGETGDVGRVITLASGAEVLLGADGLFSYNPLTAFDALGVGATGNDNFTYTISDSLGLVDSAMVTFMLTGENDDPVARNDTFGVGEDATLLQDNLLANNGAGADSDVDNGDSLSVSSVNDQAANLGAPITLPSGAVLTVMANGDFDYQPNGAFETLSQGQTLNDSFSYTLSDGNGGTDTAIATVIVAGQNDDPVAVDDSFQTIVDETFSGDVISGVNASPDSDVDQLDVLSVVELNGSSAAIGVATVIASGATVTLNADGTFTYDPTTAVFSPAPTLATPATDSFAYTLSDGVNGTDTSVVSVTIQPEGFGNAAPTVAPITAAFSEDAALFEVDLLAGTVDADGDDLDIVGLTLTSSLGREVDFTLDEETGLLSIAPGQFEALGAAIADETLTLAFGVTDGVVTTSNDGAVTILGANDGPVAADDGFLVLDTGVLSGDLFADNGAGADFDVDQGDVLSVVAVDGEAAGVGQAVALGSGALVTVLADGSFTLTPNPDTVFPDGATEIVETFAYTISDGDLTDTATFSVTIRQDTALPDLVVEGLSFAGGTGDEILDIAYDVRNAGEADTEGGFTEQVFLSTDAVLDESDILLRTLNFSADLEAGVAVSRSVQITLPDAPGEVFLLVNVDAGEAIEEEDEANNLGVAGPATIAPAYTAEILAAPAEVALGATALLSGAATRTADGAPAASEFVTIEAETNGVMRSFSAFTDADGLFTFDFAPLAEDGGVVMLSARHPGVPDEDPAAEQTLTVFGMDFVDEALIDRIIEGQTRSFDLALENIGDIDLTGLEAGFVNLDPGVLIVEVATPAALLAGEEAVVTVTIASPLDVPITGDAFVIEIGSDQGAIADLDVSLAIVDPVADLQLSIEELTAGAVLGEQRFLAFEVTNIGGDASGPIAVTASPLDFLTILTPEIASLEVGESASVTLALAPDVDDPLALFSGSIGLTAAETVASLDFAFNTVSAETGDLLVNIQDEFTFFDPAMPLVQNAMIEVRDGLTGDLVAVNADADGTANFVDLPAGFYDVSVTADAHASRSFVVEVLPGQVSVVDAFLATQAVSFNFTVTETEIQDVFEISLDSTFTTVVPRPVVLMEPQVFDLQDLDVIGDEAVIDVTFSNVAILPDGSLQTSFVQAEDLTLALGSHPFYEIVPAVDSLAVLDAGSAVTIPVTIRRIADEDTAPEGADVPCVISGQVTYSYDAGPNQVFDAIPVGYLNIDAECVTEGGQPIVFGPVQNPTNTGFDPNVGVPSDDIGFPSPPQIPVFTPSPITSVTPQLSPDGVVIAEVRISIDQEAVLTRQAFEGLLELENFTDAPLTNIEVVIEIFDEQGALVAENVFGVADPLLDGITAVDGTGELAGGTAGSAAFTIIPSRLAAGEMPEGYSIGGRLRYSTEENDFDATLAGTPVTVAPQAALVIDYFQQRDVFADDPFTLPIEPSVPFALGVLVNNVGFGEANDLTLTSAQPLIVDNDQGLLIDFELIGTTLGNEPLQPGLEVDFGDIGAGETAVASFLFRSSLQGVFSEFDASFEHVNSLDIPELSLIEEVRIHELTRIVRDDREGADDLPDFLVNEIPDEMNLPDTLFLSDGTTEGVSIGAIEVLDGDVSDLEIKVRLTGDAGWSFALFDDPSLGALRVEEVTRSDGSVLVGDNFWATDRFFPDAEERPIFLDRFNLLDFSETAGAETYTITLFDPQPNNEPVAADDLVTLVDGEVAAGSLFADNGNGVDADPDGDEIAVNAVNGAPGFVGGEITLISGALLTVGVDGGFSYDANGAFADELAEFGEATDSFTYTITDGEAEDSATVTITIDAAPNAAPTIDPIAATIGEDDVNAAVNLLAGAADADGDPVAVAGAPALAASDGRAVAATLTGGALVFANGQFEDLSDGGEITISVTYAITDGRDETPNTATVTVAGANDAPVAADLDLGVITDEDTAIAGVVGVDIPLADIATDVDDALTGAAFAVTGVTLDGAPVTLAEIGAAVDLATGALSLDPTGVAAFQALNVGGVIAVAVTYSVTDGTETDEGVITFGVSGVNDAPVAADLDLGVITDEDTLIAGAIGADISLSALATDVDDALPGAAFTLTGLTLNGAPVDAAAIGLTLDPFTGAAMLDPTGISAFQALGTGDVAAVVASFKVDDGAATDEGTVAFAVSGVNDAPEITSADAFDVAENTRAVATVAVMDVDSDQILFSIDAGADGALFEIDEDTGALSFRTAPDFEAPEDGDGDNIYELTVAASDGEDLTTQTLAVTVIDVVEDGETNPVPGTDGRDRLIGTDGPDVIDGLGGPDVLTGGGGDDVFVVTISDGITDFQEGDRIDVSGFGVQGLEELVFAPRGDRTVVIDEVTGARFRVALEGESVALDADSFIFAPVTDQFLLGDESRNALIGRAGDDVIDGAGAGDFLTGNGGADIFVASAGVDTIRDFTASEDLIDLSGTSIGGIEDLTFVDRPAAGLIELFGPGVRMRLVKQETDLAIEDLTADIFIFADLV